MTEPTDEELGDLLRETFVSKEHQVSSLPEATTITRRRTGPILLAAASVLVVLGGILFAVNGLGGADPAPVGGTTPGATTSVPGATTSQSTAAQGIPENSRIWATVIAEILKIERPAAGWPGIKILDATNAGAGGGSVTYELAKPFTAAERAGIESALAKIAPVTWVRHQPTGAQVCDQPAAKEPYLTVGPIVPNQSHIEVGVNMWRGCLDAHWMTYRLDQHNGAWTITGTVGPQGVS